MDTEIISYILVINFISSDYPSYRFRRVYWKAMHLDFDAKVRVESGYTSEDLLPAY